MIDLKKEHSDIVLDLLKRHIPAARVYVFGSRVKGSARLSSDLDLAIDSDEPLAPIDLAELEVDFSDSELPFFVDVIEFNKVSPDFQERVQEEWEIFYQPAIDSRQLT